MIRGARLLALAALVAVTRPAAANTYGAIEARGSVQCGGVPRASLAMVDGEGGWSGLEVELCGAVARAVFGDGARFEFHSYESARDFDRARTGADDLSFVSPDEIAAQKLGGVLQAGAPIFIERQALMVAATSPFDRPADLAGHAICFIIATASDNALEAWAARHALVFVPNAFQEPDEMADAYNVQHCQAIVGETTELQALRRDGGINHLKSRLLPEALATFPIIAAVPTDSDARWTDLVASTMTRSRTTIVTPGAPVEGQADIGTP